MKKPVKKYVKQVGKTITYSSKMNWSNTKAKLNASSKSLGNAAIPTNSDIAAGAFGATVGLMNGEMTYSTSSIIAKELETELIVDRASPAFSIEAFTSVAQDSFDGMVATLFPGELS